MYRASAAFLRASAIVLLLSINPAVASDNRSPAALAPAAGESPASDIGLFLDRLMLAESGGRDTAANPRSSALGPFQFIKSTFIEVARRNFAAEVAGLSDEELLELRTDRAFSRRAAEAFTAENAEFLKQQGHAATFTNLRLAFLLGAPGASRVLQAPPQTRLSEVLSAAVLRANPFMIGMHVVHLIDKAARDIWGRRGGARTRTAAPTPAAASPKIAIKCNQKLVSCQRWIALQQQKKTRKTRNAERSGKPGSGGKV